MCAIAGYIGFNGKNLLDDFSEKLKHRGPDGKGFYVGENIGLLNRRLAIIDLKTGDQPIYNKEKSLVVVFNGEIYNFRELKKELEKEGFKFTTNSDTEVILYAYEKWKENCFDKFNGMFAIALYDIRQQKLILARDHFGIKPLYYAPINNSLNKVIFASEIKPLIESGLIKKAPNDRTIYRYLKFRVHEDTYETFFEGVYKLMPGEMMIIDSNKTIKKYFSNLLKNLEKENDVKNKESKKQILNDFQKELFSAIKYRLISDVPVGTCLSGGLDSSTIVAVVNKLLSGKVKEASSIGKIQKTFSAVFPKSSNDEEIYINSVIEKIKNIKDFKIHPKPEEFFSEIEDFIKTQEEPTISTGPYAQYKVMQEASRHIKVLLDGQGSDEMMAGYLPYYFVYLKQLLKQESYFILISEIFGSFDVLIKYFLILLQRNLKYKKDISVNKLINKNFLEKYREEKFNTTGDNLKKRLAEDIFYNSLPSLLRYEDKNSMRFSIEGRVPFLDINLIKFIFSLPDEYIIKNGWNKYILRESVKNLLPDLIVKRRNKIGFTTPEYEWFIRIKNKIYNYFLSESFASRPYFNQPEVLKAFQLFIEGKFDDTMLFWRVLNLELWFRIFFDEKENNKNKNYEKGYLDPNENKKLEIEVGDKKFIRFPIKTVLFKKGDDFAKIIAGFTQEFFGKLNSNAKKNNLLNKNWFIVISEKVIAISQGRAYFIWDINPSFWAKNLSKFVRRTPYGIGLGSPWTMQLAINEVGLLRIVAATFFSATTRPFGIKGIFYHIAGRQASSIDGPTEYSLYPSNVSAKLGPKDPQEQAKKIHENIIKKLSKDGVKNFMGVAIIDANDLGQNVLGNSTNLDNSYIEAVFKDNPMGQSDEQTPLIVVFKK